LSIYEFADNSRAIRPDLFEVMGFGERPDGQCRRAWIIFAMHSPLAPASRKHDWMPLDSVESGGVGIARKDTPIAAGIVPGHGAAMQPSLPACVAQPLASFTANWYVSSDVDTTTVRCGNFVSRAGVCW